MNRDDVIPKPEGYLEANILAFARFQGQFPGVPHYTVYNQLQCFGDRESIRIAHVYCCRDSLARTYPIVIKL